MCKGKAILREILFIIAVSLFFFLGLSTVWPDLGVVGSYGKTLGLYNRELFGYISFIYPFLMPVPIYFFYKNPVINQKKLEVVLSSALLFFTFLIMQAALSSSFLKGEIGFSIVNFFYGYIGTIGIWIFILMNALLSLTILFNLNFNEIFISIKNRYHDLISSLKERFPAKIDEPLEEIIIDDEPEFQEETKDNEKELFVQLQEDLEIPPLKEQQILQLDIPKQQEETNTKKDLSPKQTSKTEILNEISQNKKLLDQIEKGESEKPKNFTLPSLNLLQEVKIKKHHINEAEIDQKIADLLEKLQKFKIEGDVIRTYSGPVVTTFEFRPAAHIKVSKILTLQDDLAMALKATTIRIQAPVPGKDVVGIEIPNNEIETIYLKEIIQSKIFQKAASPLTIVLGKDIVGNPFVTDLKKLPHLLIAGTTGSGKSVGINSMLLSLLYKNSPDRVKFLMIDPKMLEFSVYNDIPHLLTPVITQPKQAIIALSNMVVEMERRYKIMSKTKTKNIESYNIKAKREGKEEFPYIVIIIDELADLMMTSGKEAEFYIARLAQMARASGIHLIVATQRPSVDVVTGLIKANLPSRISFKVGQKIDSKVILDSLGAESLLGRGDMLFTPPGINGLIRLHAPFVAESEIERIVEFLKSQREPQYDEQFLTEEGKTSSKESEHSMQNDDFDELYDEAKNIVLTEKKTSISYIQRRLQIGYNRAARIIEQLEMMGVLSPPNNKGHREILSS